MYFAYYDESGDDGFPGSSELFTLSCIYLFESSWKDSFYAIKEFRKQLKKQTGLGTTREFHTKRFLENRKEYHHLDLSNTERVDVVGNYCAFVSSLKIRSVSLVINKLNIDANYDVSGNTLKYSIQRIENDLSKVDLPPET